MKQVGAVILAAGRSSRMKETMQENKMLLPLEGKSIIVRTVERFLASQAARVAVILGCDGERIRAELAGLPLELIDNPDYLAGMGSSLRLGIEFCQASGFQGAMICPGDMPFIQTATVNRVLAAFETGDGIITPVHQGRRGHPVLFDRKFYPEMLRVQGDLGAREIIGRHPEDVRILEIPDPGMHIDIDSKEIYQSLSGKRLGLMLKGYF